MLLQVFCSIARLCAFLGCDATTKEHLIQLAEIAIRLMSDLQNKSSILDAAVLEFCAGVGGIIGEETLFYTLCADRSMAHRLFTNIMNDSVSSLLVKPIRQLYCNVLKFCEVHAETLRSVESQLGAFTKDYIVRRLRLSTTRDFECVACCIEFCELLRQLIETSKRLPGWKWAMFEHQRVVLQVQQILFQCFLDSDGTDDLGHVAVATLHAYLDSEYWKEMDASWFDFLHCRALESIRIGQITPTIARYVMLVCENPRLARMWKASWPFDPNDVFAKAAIATWIGKQLNDDSGLRGAWHAFSIRQDRDHLSES